MGRAILFGRMLVAGGDGGDAEPPTLADVVNEGGTTYTFGSASGWSAVDATPGTDGEAAITGGVARLTALSGVSLWWNGPASYNGPSIVHAVTEAAGRSAWRCRVRLAATTTATGIYPFLFVRNAGNTAHWMLYVNTNSGAVVVARAHDNTTLATISGAAFDTTGQGWLEIEVRGASVTFRYGTGTGGVAPTTWTEAWKLSTADGVLLTHVGVGLSTNSAGAAATCDFDDFTIEPL